MNKKQVESEMVKLGKLLQAEGQALWNLADQIVRLVDVCGVLLKVIAKRYKQDISRMSQLYSTAKAFPVGKRRMDVSFYRHEVTRQSAKRVQRSVSKQIGKPYKIDLDQALAEVVKKNANTPRKASELLTSQAREKVLKPQSTAKALKVAAEGKDVINRCHHSDYLLVVPQLPEKSVKVFHLDPPYGAYRKFDDGRLDTSTSAALTACDNYNEADAIRTTVAAFGIMGRCLAENGVVLLWQAARELRLPILQAIIDNGFEVDIPVIWDKGRPQPGDFDSPYTQQTEIMWVIKRKGDSLHNCDGSARSNVLLFKPIRQDATHLEQNHMFEKPAALNEFLIKKHSNEGDLVADLFGCSGSFCVAAQTLGRQWVYCESNKDNYDLGVNRLGSALEDESAAA